MIHRATINDFKVVEKMARAFYAEADFATLYGAEIDEDSLIRFLVSFLSDQDKVVFLNEDKGMIAGALIPWFFNNSVFIAQEMAWFVQPEHRSSSTSTRLFKAFEDWAGEKGAKIFIMGSLPSLSGDRVNKFYERNGMKHTENLYGKQL